MIRRIVCMEFCPEHLRTFESLMNAHINGIRHFPGCMHMEIWHDSKNPCRVFTFSIWQDEASLDAYRNSELFQKVWSETKKLFCGKPQAWTVVTYDSIQKCLQNF